MHTAESLERCLNLKLALENHIPSTPVFIKDRRSRFFVDIRINTKTGEPEKVRKTEGSSHGR